MGWFSRSESCLGSCRATSNGGSSGLAGTSGRARRARRPVGSAGGGAAGGSANPGGGGSSSVRGSSVRGGSVRGGSGRARRPVASARSTRDGRPCRLVSPARGAGSTACGGSPGTCWCPVASWSASRLARRPVLSARGVKPGTPGGAARRPVVSPVGGIGGGGGSSARDLRPEGCGGGGGSGWSGRWGGCAVPASSPWLDPAARRPPGGVGRGRFDLVCLSTRSDTLSPPDSTERRRRRPVG